MKNKITITLALSALLTVGLGCSFIDSLRSDTNSGPAGNGQRPGAASSNTASNSANPNDLAKTGVAECDDFLDFLNNDMKDPNENFVSRKIREVAVDYAKEEIRRNIEENQGDKTKIAIGCKEAKAEYIRNKEKNNQNPNDAGQGGATNRQ